MDSLSSSISASTYTAQEQELLNTFTAICDKYQLKVLIDPEIYQIQSPAAIDIEHNEEGDLVGIGTHDGKASLYFTQVTGKLLSALCGIQFVAHNGKGDFEQLRAWGIPLSQSKLVHDTELIGHIVDSSRKVYGLKKLAEEDLGIVYPSYEDIVGKKKAKERRTLDKWPVSLVAMYNALDCYATFKLYEHQKKLYKPDYFEIVEKPVSWIFQAMENRGIRLDIPYLNALKAELEEQKKPIEAEIKNELGDINLNSPKQLSEALHEKEIFPTLKGKPSTDKRALERFKEIPTIQRLLKFSEIDTLLSSFVYPYLERKQEVVHPFFNQCGTRTGRPSCSNPNLLQIPQRTENGKRVRRMFIPRDGMLMGDCDFGQIEPRVLAHLSKDTVLCQMFNDGVDFHTFTAERLGITRDRAKVLNLSVGYRATKFSVQKQLGGSLDDAQREIDKWWSLFPQLRRWQESLIYESKRSGFCTTLLGRRICIDDLANGNSWRREGAERQLINNITQGSAAEIMKKAMSAIVNDSYGFQFHPSFGLLVQVYDELLFESPISEDIEGVKEAMVNAEKLDVPLTVDGGIGLNWAECKK